MKNIGALEINMIIKPQPCSKILEIGCGKGSITNSLAKHIQKEDGEIDLFELCEMQNYAKEFISQKNVNLKIITGFEHTIKAMPGFYEAVILTEVLDKVESPSDLLKICYRTLGVSSTIISLCHKDRDDYEKIELLFDKAHFVAMNKIELEDGFFLATARKIYNWDESI